MRIVFENDNSVQYKKSETLDDKLVSTIPRNVSPNPLTKREDHKDEEFSLTSFDY